MELIDRDELIAEIKSTSTSPLNEWDTWGVLSVVEKQKPVDAVPVVHARWIEQTVFHGGRRNSVRRICSACEINNCNRKSNYCPNCGARMDGKEQNNGTD